MADQVLSTAWGGAIFAVGLSRVAAAAVNGHTTRRLPETLLGLGVPVVIIVYMLKFSKSYPDRVTHEPAQAPTTPLTLSGRRRGSVTEGGGGFVTDPGPQRDCALEFGAPDE